MDSKCPNAPMTWRLRGFLQKKLLGQKSLSCSSNRDLRFTKDTIVESCFIKKMGSTKTQIKSGILKGTLSEERER